MGFTWNVEELKLKKERDSHKNLQIFSVENSLSRDEKIAFIDSRFDGQMSQLLDLYNKFQVEKDTIKMGVDGDYKFNSLKAWYTKNMSDFRYSDYSLEIWGIGCNRTIDRLMNKHAYDLYSDIVDQAFHQLIWDLYKKENKWFKEHDEYSILTKKLIDSNILPFLGIEYWYGTGGIGKNVNGKDIKFTLLELRYLSDACDALEEKINSIAKKIKADFERTFPD